MIRARNPFFPASEINEYLKEEDNPVFGKVNNQQPAHYARLQKVNMILIEVEEVEVKLSAILGLDELIDVHKIYKMTNDLFTKVHLYYLEEYKPKTDEYMKILKTIYGAGKDDDWKIEFRNIKSSIISNYNVHLK